MTKRFILVLLVLLAVVSYGIQFKRNIEERIEVMRDGSAIIKRTEFIPESELTKPYITHYEEMQKNKDVFNNFLNELTKHYYLLYGTTPSFTMNDMKITRDSKGYTCTITMKVPGIVKSQGGSFLIIRKGFENEKLAEKLMPKYFENEIDGKIFESAFLQSEKNSLLTERKVEIVLPSGSQLEDIKPNFFSKSLSDSWSVDMGGGTTYKAELKKTETGILISEKIVTNGGIPKNLLDEKRSIEVLQALRDYTAFSLVFSNKDMSEKNLTQPVAHKISSDFSGSWSFSVSTGELLSYTFTYQTLSVTPKITVTLSFTASLLWEHEWVRTGWLSWSYRFKKFESVVSLTPSLTPSLQVSSGGTVEKQWSKNLFTRGKTVTFWVGYVPVVLYLEAKLDAEATAKIYGSIGFTTWATFSVTTSLKVTYQNGSWSKTPSYSTSYSGVNFQANAKIGAEAEGKLPFTLSAYVYYVAGPFVKLTPWIKGATSASVGSSNQVGYTITGGLTASGGVQMAGWLKDLCGNIPSISYDFWEWSRTLASGTYTF
ncbi:MAG TPA: hypothetical protein VIL29_02560 [Pseudothermotoga sp.]